MTKFSLFIHHFLEMWTKRSPSRLLTSGRTTTRRSSSVMTRSKDSAFCKVRLQTPLQKAVGVHAQAEYGLLPWNVGCFLIVWYQPRRYNNRPSTGYRRGSNIVSDGFNVIVLHDPARNNVVHILHKTGNHLWTACHFGMQVIMSRDWTDIKQAVITKLSKIGYTFSALLLYDLILVDIANALVSCTGLFQIEYRVRFIDARLKDIVDDTLSSEYLPNW